MKRAPTLFLRIAVLAFGAVILALCIFALPVLWIHTPDEFPGVAGVLYAIWTVMYIAAMLFFVAVFQTLKLLNYIDKNQAFSDLSVKSLKVITRAAVAIGALYALTLPLFYIWTQEVDAPGLMVIGMFLTGAPLAFGVLAAVLRRLLQDAVAIKKENDLTV
jgi:hypothetical protein